MKLILGLSVLLLGSGIPAVLAQADKPVTITVGKELGLEAYAVSEKATVFAFYKPSSSLEAKFVQELGSAASRSVALRLIPLKSGEEPIAKKHGITQTPAAIVLDRRKRMVGRSTDIEEIRGFAATAGRVPRIDWAMEGTPLYEAGSEAIGKGGLKAGIMRTMSLQPEWLKHFFAMTRLSHFQDSHLTRKTKEMIATYVSGLNDCKF